MTIDPLSFVPLHIEILFNETRLSYGTGFVVLHKNTSYFITNWHVVTGRHAKTGKLLSNTAAEPNVLRIWFHRKHPDLHIWVQPTIKLFDNQGNKLWKEHPIGNKIDVIALPLGTLGSSILLHPLEFSLADTKMYIAPSDPVSIIGYPFGESSFGRFPIWKTGHIASDIDLDYEEDGSNFLIDATTKPGMSGSPVIAKRNGIVSRAPGEFSFGGAVRWLGIYSARTNSLSDIGIVWKPKTIQEILDN